MDMIMWIIIAVLALFVGIGAGIVIRKKVAEGKVTSAEQEARRLASEAVKKAEQTRKEALMEAKEEIHKNRVSAENDIRERRTEVQRNEKRLIQREEQLDKRAQLYDTKDEQLSKRAKELDKQEGELADIKKSQLAMLEKISGLTVEQAKDQLLSELKEAIKHEAALTITQNEQAVKEESDQKAKEIIALAIQRYASDYVSEVTVSVVNIPNDEMKGRIIGREGRNIRTIETMTGVDLIIDDTPEAITISSFDPIRREIARRALERLVSDGRIHPTRIEEMVEKSRKEVEDSIKKEGEKVVFECGVVGLHPELIKTLGRLKYRTSYGQNVLKHSMEVCFLSGMMAAELGVDVKLAKRAGLLHDIGKALDFEIEGSHVELGIDVAKKYKEQYEVIHAIQAHHGDVEAKTVIACIVQAADAISAARPGARRENLENYIKRLEKLESIANEFQGVEKSFAIQAGREIRVIVNPEAVSDDDIVLMAHDIVKKIEENLEYPGQIKVHIVRENRAIDYAK